MTTISHQIFSLPTCHYIPSRNSFSDIGRIWQVSPIESFKLSTCALQQYTLSHTVTDICPVVKSTPRSYYIVLVCSILSFHSNYYSTPSCSLLESCFTFFSIKLQCIVNSRLLHQDSMSWMITTPFQLKIQKGNSRRTEGPKAYLS